MRTVAYRRRFSCPSVHAACDLGQFLRFTGARTASYFTSPPLTTRWRDYGFG
jgi:hypothetical protein